MHYKASCHCGQVAFTFEGEFKEALACNCSLCGRRGSLLWFVPREQLQLLTPEDAAASYTFNKHVIQHRFCPRCGIHTHGEGRDPKGQQVAAVNVRCVEGVDLERLPVHHFDGRAI